MAVIPSLQLRFEVAEEIRRIATDAAEALRLIIELEDNLKKDERGMDEAFAKTQIEGALAGSQGPYDVIVDASHADLLNSSATPASVWPVTISPSFMADLTAFKIDNVAAVPTIEVVGDFGFSTFNGGDVIEITGAEEPEHNGRATITSIGAPAKLNLTAGDLPGTGVINLNDTLATITLVER